MIDCTGTYFIKDDRLFPVGVVEVLTTDAILIYEVLRVMDSVGLFLEEHYARLVHSAQLAGIPLAMTETDFAREIRNLVQANDLAVGNIKVLIQYGDGKQAAFFYFIPHVYPAAEAYLYGVKTDCMLAERVLPKAKTVQQSLRNTANQAIQEHQLFEVILVNVEKQVLEGSRTNLFFVKGDRFYTPRSEFVLSGITRQKVLECLGELNFSCVEQTIPMDTLADYDAAFLTGTSTKVLPIASIGEQKFDPMNQAVRALMKAYDEKMMTYIQNALRKGV
ncbi:aminotransferase class IV [uncultured Sunxiuqinia sp.]|uniref:aminotransferase class IV n=1 Tax=uncultured Sunxiuqinia sp. TaxID=1573825 RepID=UPI0026292457|nr:aminotransferase class IV [uncultured Sunxiuqinia sp.]